MKWDEVVKEYDNSLLLAEVEWVISSLVFPLFLDFAFHLPVELDGVRFATVGGVFTQTRIVFDFTPDRYLIKIHNGDTRWNFPGKGLEEYIRYRHGNRIQYELDRLAPGLARVEGARFLDSLDMLVPGV